MINILYFAALRDALGLSGEKLTPEPDVRTVADLFEQIKRHHWERVERIDNIKGLRCALNDTMVPWDHPLEGARDVAFFPPMTGG